jgi:predicted unusual protein kinase regulating ubiquinone biosynthesis (AarF/ABC1/UbiB family)
VQLPGFIPEELRQLARFVPLRGWDAIEWKPLLGSMRSVSWRYVTGRGVKKLRHATEDTFPDLGLSENLEDTVPLAGVSDAKRLQELGDDILRLYFAQWLVDDGLFLDLRPARFGVLDDDLIFAPNGLWIRLRPEFRDGILALYRSFYSTDEAAFASALRQMGMLRPGLSAASESELKELLHAHFGIDQAAQRFSIDAFKASFDDLFEFFIANDYTLHSDFVWVGFYLITLYLTLEQGGQAHNVRKICSEILL